MPKVVREARPSRRRWRVPREQERPRLREQHGTLAHREPRGLCEHRGELAVDEEVGVMRVRVDPLAHSVRHRIADGGYHDQVASSVVEVGPEVRHERLHREQTRGVHAVGHGERPAVAGVDGPQEGLADGSGQASVEGAVARLVGGEVEIFGQRRHLEELRDAVLDPRRPVRHPLLVRGDSRDALQVSHGLLQRGASRQSSGVHDPRHGASRVPVRVVARRELLGGLAPEVQAVHLIHVRRSALRLRSRRRDG